MMRRKDPPLLHLNSYSYLLDCRTSQWCVQYWLYFQISRSNPSILSSVMASVTSFCPSLSPLRPPPFPSIPSFLCPSLLSLCSSWTISGLEIGWYNLPTSDLVYSIFVFLFFSSVCSLFKIFYCICLIACSLLLWGFFFVFCFWFVLFLFSFCICILSQLKDFGRVFKHLLVVGYIWKYG